ncbi:MAG: Dabb family protein [Mycobacterium sp.]
MYSVTRLLDVDEPDRARVLGSLRTAAAASGAQNWVVEPTLPGSRNGGDVLVHLRFDSAPNYFNLDLDDPAITRVNGADYTGMPIRTGEPGSVYRALLLSVTPDTDMAAVERFERELMMLPRYVSSIRAWQLSPILEPVGATAWTHVFEQEFSDVNGLMGPYLMHPIHWAVVDRWFDPEATDCIVRDRVCHSFCNTMTAVL